MNRAKLFTKDSVMARLRDILRGWGLAVSQNILERMDRAKKPWSSAKVREAAIE